MSTASATSSFILEVTVRNNNVRVSYKNREGQRMSLRYTSAAKSTRGMLDRVEELLAARGIQVGGFWSFRNGGLSTSGYFA